ncbi:diguanylate cyclase domain-containing protein [Blautia sp. Sow4_E7]|uniref:diguanylate cyclase domain-containing protein n=1 Tax=Blautia sp. Sow4_E7 TaxID=3438749 RepID=UPI003F93F40E
MDQEILVGTEEGLYLINKRGNVNKYTDNSVLNIKRILDVKECSNGEIYAATDGYGIYEIEDDQVKNIYTKQQRLLSNVVMKIVPSDNLQGAWIVTGEGICFIDSLGNVKQATGISVANSLDLLLAGDGKAVVLAGNGFFELEEKDLLEEDISYVYLNKRDGLPINFTANARNTIQDGVLYMCGTIGAASIDLNARPVEKPIRLYVDQVTEDGKEADFSSGNIVFSSKAHRVNMDVKTINFVHRKMYVGYFLEGMDSSETIVKNTDSTDISYTNLAGGNYTYHYKVYDADSNQCLADLSVSFRKNYKFWEQARVKVLIGLLVLGALVLLFTQLIDLREKRVKKQCYLEFLQEKEAEISELAYKDLVTGVFNRNYFEQERARIDVKKLTALVSVSINHVEYFKSKYGIFYTENILRTGVSVMKKCAPEEIKICRVSENIFYFWFTKPVQLEVYIQDIKDMFQKKGEESDVPYSFSVGAIYNNTVGKENIDELIDRCGKMRLLDEKHAEAKFIEGKMKML